MNRRAIGRTAALILCAILIPNGCKDSTSPGGLGRLTVNLASNAGPGAAFLITVSGQDITDPVAVAEGQLVYSSLSESAARVAVIGEVASGALFAFTVPDVGRATDYSVHLEQVAGPDNRLLPISDFLLKISH